MKWQAWGIWKTRSGRSPYDPPEIHQRSPYEATGDLPTNSLVDLSKIFQRCTGDLPKTHRRYLDDLPVIGRRPTADISEIHLSSSHKSTRDLPAIHQRTTRDPPPFWLAKLV
jgi:hypothetical protein